MLRFHWLETQEGTEGGRSLPRAMETKTRPLLQAPAPCALYRAVDAGNLRSWKRGCLGTCLYLVLSCDLAQRCVRAARYLAQGLRRREREWESEETTALSNWAPHAIEIPASTPSARSEVLGWPTSRGRDATSPLHKGCLSVECFQAITHRSEKIHLKDQNTGTKTRCFSAWITRALLSPAGKAKVTA